MAMNANLYLKILGHAMRKKLVGAEALPPSSAMKKFLSDKGLKISTVKTSADAYRIRSMIDDREAKGLASVKQISYLYYLGVKDFEKLRSISKHTASVLIGTLTQREAPQEFGLFRVVAIKNGCHVFSRELFTSESDAEYVAAKFIKPEHDVEIVQYYEPFYRVDCTPYRYFADSCAARELAKRTNTNSHMFVFDKKGA